MRWKDDKEWYRVNNCLDIRPEKEKLLKPSKWPVTRPRFEPDPIKIDVSSFTAIPASLISQQCKSSY
jgi:hypothetical protein